MRSKDVDIESTLSGQLKSFSFIKAINHAILYEAANIGVNELCLSNLNDNLVKYCEYNGLSLTILEKYVTTALINNRNSLLSFNREGEIIHTLNESLVLTIDIQLLINNYFPSLLTLAEERNLAILTNSEQQILELSEDPRFHSVKIVKNGNKIKRAECEERLPLTKRVIDIIKDAPFQNIEIKQEAGKPVYINRVVKSKI